jgi:NitT/TauT family transport system substrate-binding protein
MNSKNLIIVALIATGLLVAGCIGGGESNDTPTVELVYMSGCGNMPSALANDQLDAYIAWQPNVAIAEVADIGKVLAYSKDLPPDGMWVNHPCCVVHARDAFVEEHYDLATYLTMLMIVASDYVQENPEIAAYDSAEWIFGNEPLTFGDTTVSSYDVEMASIPTIKFTTEPTEDWIDGLATFVHAAEDINMIEGILKGLDTEAIAGQLLHETLYDDAIALLETEAYKDASAASELPTVHFGYLAADDHDAALYVAAYEWEFFRDTYDLYLEPITLGPRGTYYLVVGGTRVAKVETLEFQGGSAQMTALSQGSVDFGLAGAPPAILFIDKGSPLSIICPLMKEGSGVVVANDAPFDDWDGFVEWIVEQHENGKTVKIGDPMLGSIQDVMIKRALLDSDIAYTG